MKPLWRHGPLAARDIYDKIPDTYGWAYKTVKTMLDQRMEATPLRGETRSTNNANDMLSSLGTANVRGSGYYH